MKYPNQNLNESFFIYLILCTKDNRSKIFMIVSIDITI